MPRTAGVGARRIVPLVGACVLLVAGLCAFSARASAVMVPLMGAQGPQLELSSDPGVAEFMQLSPGSVEHWQIATHLLAPTSTLHVQFWDNRGALVTNPNGLRVSLSRCDQPWTGLPGTPACGSGRVTIFAPVAAAVASHSTQWDLGGLTSARDKFVLVTLSIPDTSAARSDKSLMGATANIGFGVTAAEADAATTQPAPESVPSSLAFTGADVWPLALLASGAVAVGIAVRAARRDRSRS